MITVKDNIILIGMAACGKSTTGVLLAKTLGMEFIDSDVYIQAADGRSLQEIIDSDGLEAFCKIEQRCLCGLNAHNTVIATGGSAVYFPAAMQRLKSIGRVVFLDISPDEIKKRLTDITTRGLVMEPGETLETLYEKRLPLYKKYADIRIECDNLTHEQAVEAIINNL